MDRILMILEVSKKQDYIFSSNELKENVIRSNEIVRLTGGEFFKETAGDRYEETKNMVYAGGGHTILSFDSKEDATEFAKTISKEVMQINPGIELFIKQLPYKNDLSPGDNLKELTKALESKKSLRRGIEGIGVFARTTFGVEELDNVNWKPVSDDNKSEPVNIDVVAPPEGWKFPKEFGVLSGEDNFIAVVHIDGNAMGKRVEELYAGFDKSADWSDFCKAVRCFSEGIQKDFENAFSEMACELSHQEPIIKDMLKMEDGFLPLRPVILAGDDVCFVTAGSVGLECARVFLEKLSDLTNDQDGKPYAACAGVALVHQKYPFHKAYDLAEALCSEAKKFGSSINDDGKVSTMDWHIEFGQLKDGLTEIRKDYDTEDGNRMELRPVTVIVPQGIDSEEKTGNVRTYGFFRGMSLGMRGEYGKTARGKIKNLRTAFKQGKIESSFFLREKEISNLTYHAFEAEFADDQKRWEEYKRRLESNEEIVKEPFRPVDGVERCLFFDAIEMIDHCLFFEEVKK